MPMLFKLKQPQTHTDISINHAIKTHIHNHPITRLFQVVTQAVKHYISTQKTSNKANA